MTLFESGRWRSSGPRLLRLAAVALGRSAADLVVDSEYPAWLDVIEAYADGRTSSEELRTTKDAAERSRLAWLIDHRMVPTAGADVGDRSPAHHPWLQREAEAYAIPCLSAEESTRRYLLRLGVCSAVEAAAEADRVHLIRCIMGGPWTPRPFRDDWRAPDVLQLTGHAYESRDFDVLPVLGDALEEAGCDDADLLGHLRSHPLHARGCWALDAVLGLDALERRRGERASPPPP